MGAVRASQLLGLPVQQTAISLSVVSGNWPAAPRRRLPGISTPRAQEGPTQKSSSPARSGSAAPQAHRPCFSSPLNLEPYQRFPDGFGAWRRGGMLGSLLTMPTQPLSSEPRSAQGLAWYQADVRDATMQNREQDQGVLHPSWKWRRLRPSGCIGRRCATVTGERGSCLRQNRLLKHAVASSGDITPPAWHFNSCFLPSVLPSSKKHCYLRAVAPSLPSEIL